MKKICIITGSRAEYGLLQGLMQEIVIDSTLELQVIATGTHLSPDFGLTYQTIEYDGFCINEKVEILLSSDTGVGMAKSLGLGVISFAEVLDRLHPDILVLLGDRYEILAAAQAAMLVQIPIAHIAGGEITEGAVDEFIRHAITKMAQLHFVTSEVYRKRVIQLGEHPASVFNVGSTGIDNLKKMQLLSRQELARSLNFDLGKRFFMVTYHSPTLEADTINGAIELLAALNHYPDAKLIITGSNADKGGKEINTLMNDYAWQNPNRVYYTASLGQLRYISAIWHCDIVIGNSSSGIIEAPALKKAVINIGSRQSGRLKAASIIDCQAKQAAIKTAIDQALSPQFQALLPGVQSLYGEGNSAEKIITILKAVDLTEIRKRKFYDVGFDVIE
jgi:UDP-N-acetylglucosamine 2-epimerase (non-hydrolysing)/GDP/UDP-N,N'-diacetylbacillosamine 2-epimerase (hydrolysing)